MIQDNYFDALLHLLRKVHPLPFKQVLNRWTLEEDELPASPGVYCLWWINDNRFWRERDRIVINLLTDPSSNKLQPFMIRTDLLDVKHNLPVPLFVGKTGNIARRINKQLMLDVDRLPKVPLDVKEYTLKFSYFRQVFDQLFPTYTEIPSLINRYLGYSCVKLPGDENAFWRYYFKNYAIGLLRPLCNLDTFELIA